MIPTQKQTVATAKPIFSLADVPNNWEIELDDEFVKFLDKLNRPWHYDEQGRFLSGRGKHAITRESATFWESGYYSVKRERYRKLRTADYIRRHNFFEKLWGYHRYHDAHTGRYGHIKKMDRGNWITKENIATLREPFIDSLTDEDVEKLICGFRHSGASIWSRPIRQKFPIVANKYHAWLIGVYYSSGTIYHLDYEEAKRDTRVYPSLRLRLYEEAIPKVIEILGKIGTTGTLESELHRHPTGGLRPFRKTMGFKTVRRRNIKIGWPVLMVLKKFGLHETEGEHEKTGHGSRTQSPVIPDWIKDDEECLQMFIEGYLQGPRTASTLAPKEKRRVDLQVALRVSGNPRPMVQTFAKIIRSYFVKHRVKTTLHRTHYTKEMSEYTIRFNRVRSFRFLLEKFDIKNTNLRTRLYATIQAHRNRTIRKILLETRTPHNTVFAVILEKPRTKKELDALLYMRPEGIRKSLAFLTKNKMINEKNNVYFYDAKAYLRAKNSDLLFHATNFSNHIEVRLSDALTRKIRTMKIKVPRIEKHFNSHRTWESLSKGFITIHYDPILVTTDHDNLGHRILTKIDGHNGKPHEPYIKIAQILELHQRTGISIEEIEASITHIRTLNSPCSFPISLPVTTNRDWAFLFGLWFGAGSFVTRQRTLNGEEYFLRFGMDTRPFRELVTPILKTLGYEKPKMQKLYYVNQGYQHKQDHNKVHGFASDPRAFFILHRPFREIMERWGLPDSENCLAMRNDANGRSSSRMMDRTIPKWIKRNDGYSHSFVEGFLNGQSISSQFHAAYDKQKNFKAIERFVEPRFIGRKTIIMPFYRWFKKYMETKEGIKGWDHTLPLGGSKKKYNLKTHVCKGFLITSDDSMRKLHEQFRITRSDTRARLFLSYHLNAAWFEICRKLKNFEILLLGAIYENPQTTEQLCEDFRCTRKDAEETLNRLHKKFKVVKPQRGQWIIQGGFITDMLTELYQAEDTRREQTSWISAQFFSQCNVCQDIIVENAKNKPCRNFGCKGTYQPISRQQYAIAKKIPLKQRGKVKIIQAVAKETVPPYSFSSSGVSNKRYNRRQ